MCPVGKIKRLLFTHGQVGYTTVVFSLTQHSPGGGGGGGGVVKQKN